MARALVGTLSDVEEVRLVLVGQELLRFEGILLKESGHKCE